MGRELEQFPPLCALIHLNLRVDRRRAGAKSHDNAVQFVAFVDVDKLPVDHEIIARCCSTAFDALNGKAQRSQRIDQLSCQGLDDVARYLALAFCRIFDRWLLPHDSLIFLHVLRAHGKVVDKNT